MAAKRRSSGDGTAYQTKDGRWRVEIVLGTDMQGKSLRKVMYAKTSVEANAKRRVALAEKAAGVLVAGKNPTLGEWMHHWVENIAPLGKLRPRTLLNYRSYIRNWVDTSHVSRIRLDRLTPEDLDKLYAAPRHAKRSETTVSQLHRIVSRALTIAVRRGRLGSNPAKRLEAPQPADFDPDILTPEDARKLVAAAATDPNGARWIVALSLGLRQGEALGLAWDKIDLKTGTLLVQRELYSLPWQHGCPESITDPEAKKPCGRRGDHCKDRHSGGRFVGDPKSDAGKRSMSLPPQLVEVLKKHKEAQKRIRMQEGPDWTGFTAASGERLDLVFCQRNGNAVQATADWAAWKTFLKASSVDAVRPHDARHTAATLLLLMGVDGRVVMDMMGWSSMAMLKRYQHVLDVMKVEAAKKMGDTLWAAPAAPPPAPKPEHADVISMETFRSRRG